MHELSIATSIMDMITEIQRTEDFALVKALTLEVGTLCSVEVKSLTFCMDLVVQNTVAEKAQLNIIEVPAEGVCQRCGCQTLLYSRVDDCPYCKQYEWVIKGGDELKLASLEVQ